MSIFFWIISGLVVTNFVLPLVVYFKMRKKPLPPQEVLTKDANVLLAELLTGQAVIVTDVTSMRDVFLLSPRDRNE